MLVSTFDYTALDPETAKLAKQIADGIRAQLRRASAAIITIGRDLKSAKDRLGHGRFGQWLQAEFDWDERSARRFMRAAEVFGDKMDTVSVLAPTTIYLLSAKSTPGCYVAKVVADLEAGKHVDQERLHVDVYEARKRAKAARTKMKLSPTQTKVPDQPSEECRDELAAKKQTVETTSNSQLGPALAVNQVQETLPNNPISRAWTRAKVGERTEFALAHWHELLWSRQRQGGAALPEAIPPQSTVEPMPADMVVTDAQRSHA